MEPPTAPASPSSPFYRVLLAILVLGLAAAALRNAINIDQLIEQAPRLPQWDMAQRGVEGIRLADALRHGQPIVFLQEIHAMSVWPPAFPLLAAPVLLSFGYDYEVPRRLVSFLYLLSIAAIYLAGCQLDRRLGPAIGLVAAALLTASPSFHLFAALVMLEVPGVLVLSLCLGSYWRALDGDDAGRWRLAWGLVTLLFFVKYNYGLMWLVPLLVGEIWRVHGSLRQAAVWGWGCVAAINYRRGWTLFTLIYVTGISAILLAGGFSFELGGERLRLSSLGSPLYYLYVLWVLRLLIRPRQSWQRFRSWTEGLATPYRELVYWVLLPIGVWMLMPPHAREFFHFVRNRSTGIPFWSLENLLFYPRVLIEENAPSAWIGWGALVLGAGSCLVLGRSEPRRRALGLALACAAAALWLHPYKLPRFVLTLAPLLWLAAALAVVTAIDRAAAWRVGSRHSRVVALVLAGALSAVILAEGVNQHRLRRSFARHTVPRAAASVLAAVGEAVRQGDETVLMGAWNQLSPWLVEWELRERASQLVPTDLKEIRQDLQLDAICTTLDATAVIAIDLAPEAREVRATRGMRSESAWLEPYAAAIAAAPCFERESERTWSSGYRLRVYRRRGG